MTRQGAIGGLAVVTLALLEVACWPRSHPRDVGSWPKEAPPGLVMIETRPGHPGCTGAVIHDAPGTAHVLTAGHCLQRFFEAPLGEERSRMVAVLYPEPRSDGPSWRRYPVTRVVSSPSPDLTLAADGDVQWISDWAILEISTSTRLTVLPSLDREAPARPKPGELVSLLSFFDVAFDDPRPHAHDFAWARFSRELVQPGHSGAPIVWNGQVVAVFSGATSTFSWLHLSRQPDKVTLVSIETVRREAAAIGFSLDRAE